MIKVKEINMATFTIKNVEETMALANKIAAHLEPGMTLLLEGELGAGKTTFSKGIGAGLGIKRVIKSPSYTIVREYQEGRLPLYHIDLYRLEDYEVEDLGLEEYFEGDGITIVEWPSVAPEELPQERLEIKITTDLDNLNARIIHLEAVGEKYQKFTNLLNNQ